MPDGRKNNRGKIGNKGGRKSKAEELGLPGLIDEVMGKTGKQDLITKIREQAEEGSYQHQQLLMSYMYGKPKETKELNIVSDVVIDFPTED